MNLLFESLAKSRNFILFKHIISKYNICGGTLGGFCRNNGWSSQVANVSWRRNGIPKHAWFSLKKELELVNLTKSLDEKITLEDLKNDFESLDYKSFQDFKNEEFRNENRSFKSE